MGDESASEAQWIAAQQAHRSAKRKEIAGLKVTIDGWLMILLAIGTAATAFYGAGVGLVSAPQASQLFTPFVSIFVALAVAGAALGLGTLAGFLFGLPRALTSPETRPVESFDTTSPQGAVTEKGGAAERDTATSTSQVRTRQTRVFIGRFAINTNLERISDWLTTMIVGIGLSNLYILIPAIEEFGNRFIPIFGASGKVFAIGCGLYFLIFGFLLSYINTRTKLTLIFTENEYDATSLAHGLSDFEQDVQTASQAPVIRNPQSLEKFADAQRANPSDAATGAEADPASALQPLPSLVQPLKMDQRVIETILPLQQINSRDELLALANARARSGDAEGSVSLFQEIVRSSAFDLKIWLDYASALGLANREPAFLDLMVEIRSKGSSASEATARNNFAIGLLGAVQAHLYDGKFDQSIAAGETLTRYTLDPSRKTWLHIWLACAWGQSFAANKANVEVAEAARIAARIEVRNAISADESSRQLLRTLYSPAPGATDRDLEPLKPDPVLEELLADPEPAPRPAQTATPRRAATRVRKK